MKILALLFTLLLMGCATPNYTHINHSDGYIYSSHPSHTISSSIVYGSNNFYSDIYHPYYGFYGRHHNHIHFNRPRPHNTIRHNHNHYYNTFNRNHRTRHYSKPQHHNQHYYNRRPNMRFQGNINIK